MIFVTVGMHPIGFERLIRKMDEIAESRDEETIMQIGGTPYIPRHASHFRFCGQEEICELYQQARLVVTHAAMSIVDALDCGTRVIAVPRERRFGEAIDNHQVYLVRELEKQGRITAVFDIDRLPEALDKAGDAVLPITRSRQLVGALRAHLTGLHRQR